MEPFVGNFAAKTEYCNFKALVIGLPAT